MNETDRIIQEVADADAIVGAKTSVDIMADPEKAAKSISLSEISGKPATAIYDEYELHDQQEKARMAVGLVDANPFLAEYIAKDPMHPKLSSDDYGNLDQVSQVMHRFTAESFFLEGIKGFAKGITGESDFGSWPETVPGPLGMAVRQQMASNPMVWIPANAIESILRLIGGIEQGILQGAVGAAKTFATNLGADDNASTRFAREMGGATQMWLDKPHLGITQAGPTPNFKQGIDGKPVLDPNLQKIEAAVTKAGPWIERGLEPSRGLDPIIDQIKAEQNEMDLKSLDEGIKIAQQSGTKERNADIFAGFLRQHTDAKIGIDAQAVAELYGNKLPEPEDGLLGFVPTLRDQIESGLASGSDVLVPLADYIAKVDPAVNKQLRDFIRVRAGGVTKAETALAVDAWHGSPHDFDAFSMEKIGTGEGAQSYGHGLYFAENPAVAESYKQDNAGITMYQVLNRDGKVMDEFFARGHAETMAHNIGGSVKEIAGRDGNRYRVRIHANKEDFLDWDAPFEKQPQEIQKAWTSVDNLAKQLGREGPKTGADLYRMYAGYPEQSSRNLAARGIPGIKYLDQGSRKPPIEEMTQRLEMFKKDLADLERDPSIAGEQDIGVLKMHTKASIEHLEDAIKNYQPPTHNYVLFDDSLVEILEKNGEAVRTLRQVAGVDRTIADVAEAFPQQRLTLRRSSAEYRMPDVPEKAHAFELTDEKGTPQVELYIDESPNGKTLYVDDIRGLDGKGPRDFGTRAMLDVVRQIAREFPNADKLSGYRVSGMREKADSIHTHGETDIDLRKYRAKTAEARTGLTEDEIYDLGALKQWDNFRNWKNVEVAYRPGDMYTEKQTEIHNLVMEEIRRITGGKAEAYSTEGVKVDGREVGGAFAHDKNTPWGVILVSLDAQDAIGIARHEPIHWLKRNNFFKKEEWATLMEGALDSGIMERRKIQKEYAGRSLAEQVEEGVAYRFQEWKDGKVDADTPFGKVMKKLADFFDRIKLRLKEIFGREVTTEDLFKAIDRGDIAKREGSPAGGEGLAEAKTPKPEDTTKAKQLELPQAGTTRMEDRKIFERAKAMGITEVDYARLWKLVMERRKKDAANAAKWIEAAERKRQTDDWKEKAAQVRQEVVRDFRAIPELLVDRYFREGIAFDDAIAGGKPRLQLDLVREDQRKLVPKEYLAEVGQHPDDVAQMLGFRSGDEMVDALIAHSQAAKESGKRPGDYNRQLIQAEVDRQMEAKYGSLDENILERAKEQLLSELEVLMLHEDTVLVGKLAGAEFSLTPDQLKAGVKELLLRDDLTNISSDKYIADSGKAAKAAFAAMAKGDFTEAFKQKQKQQIAFLKAREARRIEMEVSKFERIVDRFSRDEVNGVEKHYTNWVRALLAQAGAPVEVNMVELYEAISRSPQKNLVSFLEAESQGKGYDFKVPDWMFSGINRPIGEWTTREFLEFKAGVDSLINAGRDQEQIRVGQVNQSREEFRQKVLENIKTRPERWTPTSNNPFYMYDAEWARMEQIVQDLDNRKHGGPMWSVTFGALGPAKEAEQAMFKKLAEQVKEIRKLGKDWRRTLNDKIAQDFFFDIGREGQPLYGKGYFTREQLLRIALNFGNRSSADNFTLGWVDRGLKGAEAKAAAQQMDARFRQLFDQNFGPKDWEFLRLTWGIFDYSKEIRDLEYRTSGTLPELIPAEPLGPTAGGFFPLFHDKFREGAGTDLAHEQKPNSGMFDQNYTRAATPQGYLVERTGAQNFVEFEGPLSQLAIRAQQMIHDITHREWVMNAGKVFYDPSIRAAIRQRYGKEWEYLFHNWLRDVATNNTMSERELGLAMRVMKAVRLNLVVDALGLNLNVFLSPAGGRLNPKDILRGLTPYSMNQAARAERDFAMEHSTEIRYMNQNYDRDFSFAIETVLKTGPWQKAKDAIGIGNADMQKFIEGVFTVTTHIDKRARVLTFNKAYREAMAEGKTHEEAIAFGDKEVRTYHGSGHISDLPQMMRRGEFARFMTLFMGFLNSQYNQVRAGVADISHGNYWSGSGKVLGVIAYGALFNYLLFTKEKEDDTWPEVAAKVASNTVLSPLLFGREIHGMLVEGHKPMNPLFSLYNNYDVLLKDLSRWFEGRDTKKATTHAATAIGRTFRLPLTNPGKSTQFLTDVARGDQTYDTLMEFVRGLKTGSAELPRR